MKKILLDLLICPACLPEEICLRETIRELSGEDILDGDLTCTVCGTIYPIRNGVAELALNGTFPENKYESPPVISSYLWSQYADFLEDENGSDAYRKWVALMTPHQGLAIDAGAAVGRFTFEMGQKCDFAVGIDTSRAFIRTARELMLRRQIKVPLKQEGNITADVLVSLPAQWGCGNVEFIVGDVLALPFRSESTRSFSSLNLIDKVPRPLQHLLEMNRVVCREKAQFLLSDPFSWSEESACEEEWLGGKTGGPNAGRGLENITAMLGGNPCRLLPSWNIESKGHVWWKIRTHSNHFEQIRSCYVKACR